MKCGIQVLKLDLIFHVDSDFREVQSIINHGPYSTMKKLCIVLLKSLFCDIIPMILILSRVVNISEFNNSFVNVMLLPLSW